MSLLLNVCTRLAIYMKVIKNDSHLLSNLLLKLFVPGKVDIVIAA